MSARILQFPPRPGRGVALDPAISACAPWILCAAVTCTWLRLVAARI